MTEHPTVTVNGKEMELIEFHRVKQALEIRKKNLEKEIDRIKTDPKADFHDEERELSILENALETFEHVYGDYEDEYGELIVQSMII